MGDSDGRLGWATRMGDSDGRLGWVLTRGRRLARAGRLRAGRRRGERRFPGRTHPAPSQSPTGGDYFARKGYFAQDSEDQSGCGALLVRGAAIANLA